MVHLNRYRADSYSLSEYWKVNVSSAVNSESQNNKLMDKIMCFFKFEHLLWFRFLVYTLKIHFYLYRAWWITSMNLSERFTVVVEDLIIEIR
jgi:hypothetical protein